MKGVRKELRPKLIRVVIALTVVVALFLFTSSYFRNNVKPVVIGNSTAHVRAIGTNALNLAATSVVSDGISYDELFTVVKDSVGDIAMIQANSPKINAMARQIANLAQANLDDLGVQTVSIALGTFTGLALLTGLGPMVSINVTPIGAANCEFVSYFQNAGINQTLHKIYIDLYANIKTVTPMNETNTVVKVEIMICENLIVGKVPQVYLSGGKVSEMFDLVA